MTASYLRSKELNNLDNEICPCITQFKLWKKGSNTETYINKLKKSMTLMIYPKIIFYLDWQLCGVKDQDQAF